MKFSKIKVCKDNNKFQLSREEKELMFNRSKIFITAFFLLVICLLMIPNMYSREKNKTGIRNIGPPINTKYDEFAPSLTADGKTMVFNSKSQGKYLDIFICYYEEGEWTEPELLPRLNSKYSDESPYITPDGSFIFFSSDRDGSLEIPRDKQGKVRVSFDLYLSKNIKGFWDYPIKIPGNVNTIHHERSPCLSPDSKTLFYSDWPFGEIKKSRIMKADYHNGEFINPVALPAPVNVGGQEAGIVPSQDGKGYYFSSMRPGGYGGWDIYYVTYRKDKFGIPVNQGHEINTDANEMYLSLIGKTMYFCSNRDGGYGRYDIYISGIPEDPEKQKQIVIVVKDKKTKKPLTVDVDISTKIKNSRKKKVINEIKKKTGKNGKAIVKRNPKVKKLDIIVKEKGYLPHFKTVEILSLKGKPIIVELVPIEEDESFDIQEINFDFESAKIKKESYPYLNALADYLKQNPALKFEIIGHTDLHGTNRFNYRLSLARANAVKKYLIARGLDAKRFTVKGAGKSQPRIRKKGLEFDEKNRRTEFKLKGK